MFCPECGREVADGAKFCPHCGKNLAVSDEVDDQEEDVAEGETPPTAVPESPQYATPETPEPAGPGPDAPEPAAPGPETPLPPAYDSAREGAAEEAAAKAEGPRAPTPQPTPQPPASAAPTQPPPPAAVPSASGQPGAQAPPPVAPGPAPGATPGAPPPEEKKTNWGSICLIGCGILLVLAILIGAALYFIGKRVAQEIPESVTNQVRIEEPGNTDDEGTDAVSGPEINEPGEGEDAGDDLGELIGRLGEAVEGAGQAISAANVKGFDPSTVDAQMLPTFYGFMIALAEDNPQGMYQWMSPELKEQWSPDDWTVSPHIEHLSYELAEKTTLDDGTVKFVIDETIQDNEENAEKVLSWEIHFEQINGEWSVTYLE